LALFLLSTDEIPPELLALLGPSEQVAEGRPHDIAKYFFGVAGGASARFQTWRLLLIEPPDSQTIPIMIQAVREGLEGEESFQMKLEVPAATARVVADGARALLEFAAVFRPDPEKTGEIILAPKPR
jgi:hypothetical protein